MAILIDTEDLIGEILSWVPVESLMRFRCVSKSWNSLIFHPTFVKLHLQRSSKNTHILLRCRRDKRFYDSGEFIGQCSIRDLLETPSSTVDDACHQLDPSCFFMGSCNGLVSLVYHSDSLDRHGFMEYRVRFWNPATRIMSPFLSHLTFRSRDHYLSFGFGYDDLSDTYKVVLLVHMESGIREVRVHCLGDTNTDTCWRITVTVTYPDFLLLQGLDGKLVSGTLNWLAIRRYPDSVNRLVIFSYDLNKETYKFLSLPSGLSKLPVADAPCLGVLKDCLCLYHSQDQGGIRFVIWLMREFGVENSCTPWLNMSFEQGHVYPPWPLMAAPLSCMFENDDVILLANYPRSQYIFYNRRDNRIVRAEYFNYVVPLCSQDYVQSLVLPY